MRGRIRSPETILKTCGVVLAVAVACPTSSAQEQYTFGGQVRLRVERWRGLNFGDSLPDDDTFLPTRLLFHAEWRASRAAA